MAKRAVAFWSTHHIIDLFIQMGCLHNVAEETVTGPDGDCYGLSYLVNPENGQFAPILDLHPDDAISEIEIESWERRLGVAIPKPPIKNP